ncbi:hypothetical protein ACIQM4_12505 [Streptomyces sp. NPDC091272]|uniref:hypothetical protein n=1 Tax=Streptomyces sp. NPDC091272 TaxID=3365981 RepID=UPI00380381E0
MIVACSPHEATLWLGQHKWSDYEWRSGDAGELEDLAETLAAVQRGEGELHFRAHQRHLVYQGGRVGHQIIALAPFTDKTLTLALPAWSRASEDGCEATAGYPGP